MWPLDKPQAVNVIADQAHFTKTAGDRHEALARAGSRLRCGATAIASSRLVRLDASRGRTSAARLRGLTNNGTTSGGKCL